MQKQICYFAPASTRGLRGCHALFPHISMHAPSLHRPVLLPWCYARFSLAMHISPPLPGLVFSCDHARLCFASNSARCARWAPGLPLAAEHAFLSTVHALAVMPVPASSTLAVSGGLAWGFGMDVRSVLPSVPFHCTARSCNAAMPPSLSRHAISRLRVSTICWLSIAVMSVSLLDGAVLQY